MPMQLRLSLASKIALSTPIRLHTLKRFSRPIPLATTKLAIPNRAPSKIFEDPKLKSSQRMAGKKDESATKGTGFIENCPTEIIANIPLLEKTKMKTISKGHKLGNARRADDLTSPRKKSPEKQQTNPHNNTSTVFDTPESHKSLQYLRNQRKLSGGSKDNNKIPNNIHGTPESDKSLQHQRNLRKQSGSSKDKSHAALRQNKYAVIFFI
jgi:hypothetical protein